MTVIVSLISIWRYLKFQFVYKRKFSKTPGIPSLCSNVHHPYHESKFEQETCEVLCSILSEKEVLVPSQHKFPIKFDFVVPKTAIIEPHAIWSNRAGEDTFFDYYKQRREHADKYEELRELPVVVLTNSTDVNFLKNTLREASNYKKACQEVTSTLLEKYKTNQLTKQQESVIKIPNIWIVAFLLVSICINVYLLFFK